MRNHLPHAVQSCHELLLWIIPQLDKFPKARRFTPVLKMDVTRYFPSIDRAIL